MITGMFIWKINATSFGSVKISSGLSSRRAMSEVLTLLPVERLADPEPLGLVPVGRESDWLSPREVVEIVVSPIRFDKISQVSYDVIPKYCCVPMWSDPARKKTRTGTIRPS